jgi:hypothetical protein
VRCARASARRGTARALPRPRRWLGGALAADPLIAEPGDDADLAEHRLSRGRLEGRLVDQRAQVVFVGSFREGVMLVDLCHLARVRGGHGGMQSPDRGTPLPRRRLRPHRPRAIRAGEKRRHSCPHRLEPGDQDVGSPGLFPAAYRRFHRFGSFKTTSAAVVCNTSAVSFGT